MKNLITLTFLLAGSTLVFAQDLKDKNLQAMVNAERAFAQLAKEKNTRDAFLTWFADSAVTSAPNRGPRIGKKHLEAQQPNESWLWWEPEYSDIASSGDFGFNTGPWEFRQQKTDEKPVAYGHFVSIWKKDHGGWKVAVDIGIGYPQPVEKKTLTTSSLPLTKKPAAPGNKIELLAQEQKFIEAFAAKGNAAYEPVRSKEIRFYRGGHTPYTTSKAAQELLAMPTPSIAYTLMDGDIASAGDLAYVYGKVTINNNDGAHLGSYMRFWKKEDGKSWKIVLDLYTN
jgi:ketosteroid isomerase-like protein